MQRAKHNPQTIAQAIDISISKHIPLFAYRLPNTTQIEFGAEITPKEEGYKFGEKGFIFAPYNTTEYPIIHIHDDINSSTPNLIEELQNAPQHTQHTTPTPNYAISREEYIKWGSEIIEAIKRGELHKAVYSRTLNCDIELNISECFIELTKKYPSAYVFLVSAPNKTLWMGATPELFIKQDGVQIETMALASTIKIDDTTQWGEKEYAEQEIVTKYVIEQFRKADITPQISPLEEIYAGSIKHLCNKITATEHCQDKINTLITHLHPTPAVCGTPKDAAQNIIKKYENRSRRYYAGYLGYIYSSKKYSLFVNLRSMEIFNNMVQLYVGGGITSHSNIQDEWSETVNKSATLLNCIK